MLTGSTATTTAQGPAAGAVPDGELAAPAPDHCKSWHCYTAGGYITLSSPTAPGVVVAFALQKANLEHRVVLLAQMDLD